MLTDDRIDAIFQEVDTLVIELASDPGSLGPQYFQDLIATCRNYLNRAGLILSELNRERLVASSEVRALEAAYDLSYDDLLTNDASIAGSSIDDRKAAVGWRLRDQRTALTKARATLHSITAVHKVVSFRSKELHATMAAIRDQKRLIVAEIRSGSFYGDERPNPVGRRPGDDDGISAEELARLLSADEPESVLEPQSSGVDAENSALLRFLDGPER